MAELLKGDWLSSCSTIMWGTRVSEDVAAPVTDSLGETFVPQTVEWIKYWFSDKQSTGSSTVQTYTIVYAHREEPSKTTFFDLRVTSVPEWVPQPPDGWDDVASSIATTTPPVVE